MIVIDIVKNDDIFNYWNSKNIFVHRKINSKILKHLNESILLFGVKYIKNSIDHYVIAYMNKDYFFNYRYQLDLFLKGCKYNNNVSAVEKFADNGVNWNDYIKYKGGGYNGKR